MGANAYQGTSQQCTSTANIAARLHAQQHVHSPATQSQASCASEGVYASRPATKQLNVLHAMHQHGTLASSFGGGAFPERAQNVD